MSLVGIRPAKLEDRSLIRSISERTWPSTYGHIISKEQIDFMLDWMYSDESLAGQFEKGHQFFIAQLNGNDIGFCSVSKAMRGKGIINSTSFISYPIYKNQERGQPYYLKQ
jgi:hypothetical protein